MKLRLNKAALTGFTLVEVLIAAGILTTVVVFIFRSLATVLSSVQFSQNTTLACLLTEEKLCEIQMKQKAGLNLDSGDSGQEKLQGKEFNWSWQLEEKDSAGIKKIKELDFVVSWPEGAKRRAGYAVNTYLLK